MKIQGQKIYLRILSGEDSLSSYIRWMNDEEVMRFTESKGRKYSIQDLKEYIRAMSDSKNKLFGIFLRENDRHIGNIKIGNIHPIHKRADIGLIIGEKDLWGKGLGQEAIALVTEHAFSVLKLKTVYAGVLSNNVGSYKAFLKAGFQKAGIFKNSFFYEGHFVDGIVVEKVNEDYKNE